MEEQKTGSGGKRKITKIEIVGLILFIGSMVLLIINPKAMGDLFTAMFNRAKPVVVDTFLISSVTGAIVISVMIGRLLNAWALPMR